jgi:hypothetical protein
VLALLFLFLLFFCGGFFACFLVMALGSQIHQERGE